jgi:hypothetical protein
MSRAAKTTTDAEARAMAPAVGRLSLATICGVRAYCTRNPMLSFTPESLPDPMTTTRFGLIT